MDAFFGSWKVVERENVNDYLEAHGLDAEAKSIGHAVKPVITISQEDDSIVIKTQTVISQKEIRFRLGEEFDDETIDGTVCKAVANLEGEKLILVQKSDGKEITTVREIQDGKMITTLTCDEITGVFIYQKV